MGFISNGMATDTDDSKFTLDGFAKYLYSARFGGLINGTYHDHLLHNRLNMRWDFSERLNWSGSLRSRIFAGNSVRDIPEFGNFIDMDNSGLNTSILWKAGDQFFFHSNLDRFFVNWEKDQWNIRLGRQRINWGITNVFNPNDLFNSYSFYDFNYEERPGADALRIVHYTGMLSSWELGVSYDRSRGGSVAALKYRFNFKGYDLQFLGGYFHERVALGGGWAGSIKGMGFKGEFTWFSDLNTSGSDNSSNWVVAVSGDYLFPNGIFLIVEYLFSQSRSNAPLSPLFFTQPLSADRLSFADHNFAISAQYPINPILSVGGAAIYYPDLNGLFMSPTINYNWLQDFDLQLVGQFFAGKRDSLLGEAGSLIALSGRWSF